MASSLSLEGLEGQNGSEDLVCVDGAITRWIQEDRWFDEVAFIPRDGHRLSRLWCLSCLALRTS